MLESLRFPEVSCCLLLALTCEACGSDADNANSADASKGQVTEAWQDYCVAEFSADYAVQDPFGDTNFTARVGEKYLMAEYAPTIDADGATLLYLTPAGPARFDIEVPKDSRAFPFTTACAFDAAIPYYAVFKATKVYTTEDLTSPLCDLEAETVLPRDATKSSGFTAQSLNLSGPTTFQVMLNAFSERCGGTTEGYISVPETEVFGATTWLVPIVTILGPK